MAQTKTVSGLSFSETRTGTVEGGECGLLVLKMRPTGGGPYPDRRGGLLHQGNGSSKRDSGC